MGIIHFLPLEKVRQQISCNYITLEKSDYKNSFYNKFLKNNKVVAN